MNILAIIPARSKSKGVKNKNIKKINGKELIYYTIKRAKESKLISNIIASTDSKIYSKLFQSQQRQVGISPDCRVCKEQLVRILPTWKRRVSEEGAGSHGAQ